MRGVLVLALLLLPAWARAQDRFEIQVYDAETAPPGGAGIEIHVNTVAAGTTSVGADGEAPTNHVTHVTFEPHLGLTRWGELGAYLQSAFFADGSLHWAGLKLRFKARVPRRLAGGLIGLALNGEISIVPRAFEPNIWGSELRPIFDLRWRRLYFSVNPIVDIDFAGAAAGRPQLQPAVKLSVDLAGGLAAGAEYYAAFGPLTAVLPLGQQLHRLMAVLDFFRALSPRVDLDINLGVGYNLAGGGDRWLVKAIVGIGR